MKLPLHQLDAFADRLFAGNPAAVVVLPFWLSAATLQAIAAENNLSETAFVIPGEEVSRLRWFTPTKEVDLCGHATLATSFVLFRDYFPEAAALGFDTASGRLTVTREGSGRFSPADMLSLDFPARPAQCVPLPAGLADALGAQPVETWSAQAVMAVFAAPEDVLALRPDMAKVAVLDASRVIATAPGCHGVDFVSRFFAPQVGVPEDPVTGSAHCTLIPYWAARLGKTQLHARQVSARGGVLDCELQGERVRIAGRVVSYLSGEIEIHVRPDA